MKKDNLIKPLKEKKSFQSQLFFIVLVVFIFFILLEYIIVDFVLNKRYLNIQIDEEITNVSSLLTTDSLYKELNIYKDSSSSIPLVIDSTDGIRLKDYKYNEYKIVISNLENTYDVIIDDYLLSFSLNQIFDELYVELIDSNYHLKGYKINGEEYISSESTSYTYLSDMKIVNIEKPENINYLYINNINAEIALKYLSENYNSFNKSKVEGISYSTDKDSKKVYYLIDKDNCLILIVSKYVETENLSKAISAYYGYIIIGSVVIAVLIALFISRAFSLPIKDIEREMKRLSEGKYEKSNYEFTNSELTSLQDTLNSVKEDTKERVLLLEEQTNELKKKNNIILSEEDLRKSFIARLSHELKTPLMVISATTEALMDGVIEKDKEKDEFENILKEVEKSNSIIKDIIQTYKSSKETKKINITRFNLSDTLKETIESMISLKDTNNIEVIESIQENVYIDADIEQIKLVISNFLTNAFKYTSNNKIEILLKESKNEVSFSVKNFGAHIDEANLDKIWLPFFREKENVDSVSTGMGLFIVKEILETHKFKYGVENFSKGVLSYFKVQK